MCLLESRQVIGFFLRPELSVDLDIPADGGLEHGYCTLVSVAGENADRESQFLESADGFLGGVSKTLANSAHGDQLTVDF